MIDVDKVLLLLVTIQDSEAVAQACIEKLKIDPGQVDDVIDKARRRLAATSLSTRRRYRRGLSGHCKPCSWGLAVSNWSRRSKRN